VKKELERLELEVVTINSELLDSMLVTLSGNLNLLSLRPKLLALLSILLIQNLSELTLFLRVQLLELMLFHSRISLSKNTLDLRLIKRSKNSTLALRTGMPPKVKMILKLN
jgi:hypothetical protein